MTLYLLLCFFPLILVNSNKIISAIDWGVGPHDQQNFTSWTKIWGGFFLALGFFFVLPSSCSNLAPFPLMNWGLEASHGVFSYLVHHRLLSWASTSVSLHLMLSSRIGSLPVPFVLPATSKLQHSSPGQVPSFSSKLLWHCPSDVLITASLPLRLFALLSLHFVVVVRPHGVASVSTHLWSRSWRYRY